MMAANRLKSIVPLLVLYYFSTHALSKFLAFAWRNIKKPSALNSETIQLYFRLFVRSDQICKFLMKSFQLCNTLVRDTYIREVIDTAFHISSILEVTNSIIFEEVGSFGFFICNFNWCLVHS